VSFGGCRQWRGPILTRCVMRPDALLPQKW
jgi:hypothetical protein